MMPVMNYLGIASWNAANVACLCIMAPLINKPARSMKNVYASAIWNGCGIY